VFCGECVQACPVGALVEKDARGKVWPGDIQKSVRTTCTYCGVGCQTELHIKDNGVVKITGVEGVAPNYGSLCVKGRFGFDFIGSPERLKTPLIREKDGFGRPRGGRRSIWWPADWARSRPPTGRTASGS
jgi:predicted molibdopterin-dependent oxidoreductase YjgC